MKSLFTTTTKIENSAILWDNALIVYTVEFPAIRLYFFQKNIFVKSDFTNFLALFADISALALRMKIS